MAAGVDAADTEDADSLLVGAREEAVEQSVALAVGEV